MGSTLEQNFTCKVALRFGSSFFCASFTRRTFMRNFLDATVFWENWNQPNLILIILKVIAVKSSHVGKHILLDLKVPPDFLPTFSPSISSSFSQQSRFLQAALNGSVMNLLVNLYLHENRWHTISRAKFSTFELGYTLNLWEQWKFTES